MVSFMTRLIAISDLDYVYMYIIISFTSEGVVIIISYTIIPHLNAFATN